MTNRFIYPLITFCILASCNSETKTKAILIPEKTEKVADEKTPNSCFMAVSKKDTIILQIDKRENGVSGTLVYNLFEKDKNSGIIRGEMRGDTLVAEYTFSSEGIRSVREVCFLQQGLELVEGYGEMVEKDGRMIFKNIAALNFDSKTKLAQVNCDGR